LPQNATALPYVRSGVETRFDMASIATLASGFFVRVSFIMAGLSGQRSALAAPYRGFRPHLSPSPCSRKYGGGYHQDME